MFKISHEVPIALLEESKKFNDYDYALVHLFDKHPKYLDFYMKQTAAGREVILDNSAYELGEPMSGQKYLQAIYKLQPTEYIIPDYRDNSVRTLEAAREWSCASKAKRIGVIHGNSYEDYCQNYRDMKNYVDKIAFSFESFFIKWAEQGNMTLAEARIDILRSMVEDHVIDYLMPHHILGALSPTEYREYVKWGWIESVDTSNPVLHGLIGQRYVGEKGLNEKSDIKLEELIADEVTNKQFFDVMHNVEWFRGQFRGISRHNKSRAEVQIEESIKNQKKNPDVVIIQASDVDCIRKELGSDKPKVPFQEITESLTSLLEYKNEKYGNSALEPLKVFSGKCKTGTRIDDKLARIKNNPELQKNDVADVMGYLVLICAEKGWTNFDEFKD